MKHKMMLAALLMVPVVCHADEPSERDLHIGKLKVVQFKFEEDIARLSKRILKESYPLAEYRAIALDFWKPSDGKGKEASFDEFMIQICQAFEAGEDTEALCQKAPLIEVPHRNTHLFTLRVALQFLFIERLTAQYKQLINELIEITKELITLESKDKL